MEERPDRWAAKGFGSERANRGLLGVPFEETTAGNREEKTLPTTKKPQIATEAPPDEHEEEGEGDTEESDSSTEESGADENDDDDDNSTSNNDDDDEEETDSEPEEDNQRTTNEQSSALFPPRTTPAAGSLSAAIFGAPAAEPAPGSLSAAIFGPATANDAPAFGSRAVAPRKRRRSRKAATTTEEGGAPGTTTRGGSPTPTTSTAALLQARRAHAASTSDLLEDLTVAIPPELLAAGTPRDDDEEEEEEIRGGVFRLFCRQAEHSLRDSGVVLLRADDGPSAGLFDPSLYASLRAAAEEIQRDVVAALDRAGKAWNPRRAQPRAEEASVGASDNKDTKDDKACFSYHEVAARCLGRLDIRYGMDRPPFSSPGVTNNRWLMPLVASLLGEDARLVYAGLIPSFPGSLDQPWHQDGHPLFPELLKQQWELRQHQLRQKQRRKRAQQKRLRKKKQQQQQEREDHKRKKNRREEPPMVPVAFEEDDSEDDAFPPAGMDLPPYALNVFVPLMQIDEALGPTEFWPGSHKESNWIQVQEALHKLQDEDDDYHQSEEDGAPVPSEAERALRKAMPNGGRDVIAPTLDSGDVLIYDYRTCHRGTANASSDTVRPMLYLMYARPWFAEHVNFGNERLFPDNDYKEKEI